MLALVPPTVCKDTLAAVEYLRQEILAGRIVGLAWVAHCNGQGFELDIAGLARKRPTFTRGALLVLDDELARIPLER